MPFLHAPHVRCGSSAAAARTSSTTAAMSASVARWLVMQARTTKWLRTVALDRYTRPRRFTLSSSSAFCPSSDAWSPLTPSEADCAERDFGHSFERWLLVDQVGQ